MGRYSLLNELGYRALRSFSSCRSEERKRPLHPPLCCSSPPCGYPFDRQWELSTPSPPRPVKLIRYKGEYAMILLLTISSFLALSARLLLPKLRPDFLRPSRAFSTQSMSLSLNSVWIMSISRRGSTSPSTWMTSASSKARTTWKMPSTARTWDKNEFPRPAPVEAPWNERNTSLKSVKSLWG